MTKKILSLVLSLVLAFSLVACQSQPVETAKEVKKQEEAVKQGGVLLVKVNPQVEIAYDGKGVVESVKAGNKDAEPVVKNLKDSVGKEAKIVAKETVAEIGKQGYFAPDKTTGKGKEVVLELQEGSQLPSETFLTDVAKEVQGFISENQENKTDLTVKENGKDKKLNPEGKLDLKENVVETKKETKAETKKETKVETKAETKKENAISVPVAPADTDYDGVDTNYDDKNTNYDDNDNQVDANTDYDDNDNQVDVDTNYDDTNTNYDDNNDDYDQVDVDTNYDDANTNYDDNNDNDDSGYDD